MGVGEGGSVHKNKGTGSLEGGETTKNKITFGKTKKIKNKNNLGQLSSEMPRKRQLVF